jgi:DNA-binding transcriptional ArsR family regulator
MEEKETAEMKTNSPLLINDQSTNNSAAPPPQETTKMKKNTAISRLQPAHRDHSTKARILEYLRQEPDGGCASEICAQFDATKSRVLSALHSLLKKGLVEKTGERRPYVWKAKGQMEEGRPPAARKMEAGAEDGANNTNRLERKQPAPESQQQCSASARESTRVIFEEPVNQPVAVSVVVTITNARISDIARIRRMLEALEGTID